MKKAKLKYLYLDDEPNQVKAYSDWLEDANPNITVTNATPKLFGEQLDLIKSQKWDGLIFDLRLDAFPNDDGDIVEYKAFSLAQEIRTQASDGALTDIPIVIFSSDQNLQKLYRGDQTGHDLVDGCYDKNDVQKNVLKIAAELESLANGYRAIRDCKKRGAQSKLMELLRLEEKRGELLDKRLLSCFPSRENISPHEYARTILQSIVRRPGALIGEEILAARLGVDIGASDGWHSLLSVISKIPGAKYDGPFASAWPRWWSSLIEAWWNELKDCPGSLGTLRANDRVEFLKKVTKIKALMAAMPIEKQYSDRFWTICFIYLQPLDPVNGIWIDEPEPKPWQEKRYLSQKAALNEVDNSKGSYKVNPAEAERFEALRKRRTDEKRRQDSVPKRTRK